MSANTNAKATVYAVQQQHTRKGSSIVKKFNFEDARRFGKVEILLEESANTFELKPVIETLHAKLTRIKRDDWLILTGNPTLIGLTVAIAADYLDGCLRMLQWSGSHNCYIPITLENLYNEES